MVLQLAAPLNTHRDVQQGARGRFYGRAEANDTFLYDALRWLVRHDRGGVSIRRIRRIVVGLFTYQYGNHQHMGDQCPLIV